MTRKPAPFLRNSTHVINSTTLSVRLSSGGCRQDRGKVLRKPRSSAVPPRRPRPATADHSSLPDGDPDELVDQALGEHLRRTFARSRSGRPRSGHHGGPPPRSGGACGHSPGPAARRPRPRSARRRPRLSAGSRRPHQRLGPLDDRVGPLLERGGRSRPRWLRSSTPAIAASRLAEAVGPGSGAAATVAATSTSPPVALGGPRSSCRNRPPARPARSPQTWSQHLEEDRLAAVESSAARFDLGQADPLTQLRAG